MMYLMHICDAINAHTYTQHTCTHSPCNHLTTETVIERLVMVRWVIGLILHG